MTIALIIVAAVFVAVLGARFYKQIKIARHKRMSQNEYTTAVKLWEYARLVRDEVNTAIRQGRGVLDFRSITVPHSPGYAMSLELIGSYFRVYAVPNRYNRTGRLSFVADSTLTVRASDRAGERATPEDAEYEGNSEA